MSAPASGRSGLRWHVWLLPAALAVAAVGLLCWGAWVYGYNPAWLSGAYSWWRPVMETNHDGTLLATVGLLTAALGLYWWPRRRDRIPIALVAVVVLVLVAAVLGTAAYVPCRGHMSTTGVTFWIFQLYVGQPPNMIYQSVGNPAANCGGTPPLALQLGQVTGLGATGIGAVAVASVLWRKPLDHLQARFAHDVTVFTGLSALTLPLLRRLAQDARNPRSVIVIESDDKNPLLEEAKLTGARVVVGSPGSPRILRPIVSALRGCALDQLYALSEKVADNEAVIEEAERILSRHSKAEPDRQPHLVALVDDPRHASRWRGDRSGRSSLWFVDALSSAECTACSLVTQVLRKQPRHLLVCGDSTLTVPILVELARRAWEQAELVKAAAGSPQAADGAPALGPPSPLPVAEVTLLDPRSPHIKREYHRSAPGTVLGSLPDLVALPVPWRDHLQERLDALNPAEARETAVIITECPPGSGVHEAGRVARLCPETPVFVLAASGDASGGAIFDLLHPFEPGLLIDGKVPEDTWTRVARHWHECYRLSHPVPAGDPKADARLPWSELDPFLRQDNVLQLRSVLIQTRKRGRQWVPAHLVRDGSLIELSERELTAIAAAEHTRWVNRRLAAGQAGGNVVPWEHLSPRTRADVTSHLRSQLSQLEAVGFVPVIPPGGPPKAAVRRFERIGLVRAVRLTRALTWTSQAGEQMRGEPGDWRVTDDEGNVRTVGDPEFRSSHELVGGDLWRRVGVYLAWPASEEMVIRTKEGNATARAGDWVVEAPGGERWPVSAGQFEWSYQPCPPDLPAPPGEAPAPGITSGTAPVIPS